MDNPFVALGEAVHDGLGRLHKRADDIATAAEEKADALASEFKAEVSRVEEALGDRIGKLEAMFTPEAVAAVTEKLASVGGAPSIPDPVTASASVPVSTEEGNPNAQASASASDPASSSATVDPGVTDAVKPISVMAPSGAMVTVDPAVGATTHEAEDGTVTVLPHDGTDAHAHDAAMQPAEVTAEAVQEAVQATVDAGVAVPEKADATVPEAAPVI